jgi:hypothetical protein
MSRIKIGKVTMSEKTWKIAKLVEKFAIDNPHNLWYTVSKSKKKE